MLSPCPPAPIRIIHDAARSGLIRRKSDDSTSISAFGHYVMVGGAPLAVVKQYIENQQTSERPNERAKWANYLEGLN